jgi:anthranilate phosphoribosyltransferase
MFAPLFHPAMKYAAAPRREIGIRTIFNLIGPLTNPAGAGAQLVGVANVAMIEKIAVALQFLGCQHALVVHGESGLDEIAIKGRTLVYELKDNKINSYYVSPEDFGLAEANLESIRGGTAAKNAAILRNILSGALGSQRDIVLMNTAAVLLAGERVENMGQGFKIAQEVIDSGKAIHKMEQLIAFSQA